MAWSPELQNRLIVVPAVVTGSPARMAGNRATLCPGAPAGAHRRDAGDVGAGGAFGRGAAQDHVLDLAQLDLGAFGGVLDHVRAHVGAMRVVEDTAERLADRRSGGGYNDGV